MIDAKKIGQYIREARIRCGMSQQELAGAIGVSDKTISAYEVGRIEPPLQVLGKLSQATAHPVTYFFGEAQSNIEARLERISNELEEIRRLLSEHDSK